MKDKYKYELSIDLFNTIKNTFVGYLSGIETIDSEKYIKLTCPFGKTRVRFVDGLSDYYLLDKYDYIVRCHYQYCENSRLNYFFH